MSDKLTQQEVNQAAWAACDTFRGVVDAGQYKDYILDYGTTQDAIQLGIRYAYQVAGNCALYAGTSWSRLLDGNAYVPDWFTPQAGVAWTFADGGMISLGFEGQFGQNDWQSYGGQLTLVIPF